ncbi:hypothetical protein [Photobacterium sanguinicancri]|uniref:hypothetical protein n=1 Tax=Photobacterium TaxID=657 RepID=UPI0026E41C52|nr:hypothetical protein [Photobacterium sanguinicancri]MDO6496830.1 hypothetical protein [Photobacterium sanguinicancri]
MFNDLVWLSELPTEEGIYLLDDLVNPERQVEITNLKIDDNPMRPDNFHVIEGETYYALSIENGCGDWLWAKIG